MSGLARIGRFCARSTSSLGPRYAPARCAGHCALCRSRICLAVVAFRAANSGGTGVMAPSPANQALQAARRHSLRMPEYPRSKNSLGAPERER
jgi:hypothetical protein